MSRRRRLLAVWAFLVFGLAIRAFARAVLPPAETVRIEPRSIDVNRAGVAELQALPGIGPSRAEGIVLERIRHGPFRSPADLQRVHGIGPEVVAQLTPLISCSEPAVPSPPR